MLMTALILLLPGCLFKSTDELYAVPQASEEYVNLRAAIDAAKGAADFAAPTSGRNTQTVQLMDLDEDGVQEAITFFRDTASDKPLKIYIFRLNGKDEYVVDAVIEGDGTSIESISYRNLGGAPSKEIIVSWRMSTSVRTLVAYRVDQGTVTELMRTGYSYYVAADMDGSGTQELLLLQVDTAEHQGVVEYYQYQDGAMALRSSAPLSNGIFDVRAYRAGKLKDDVPALFVTSQYGDSAVITDVFCVEDQQLVNVTLDETTGRSGETLRFYTSVEPADINRDGRLELPQPQVIRSYNKSTAADDFWVIKWRQFDREGEAWPVFTTYHNYNSLDRWYLVLPDEWEGKFTLSRRDANTAAGERAMVFSYWTGDEKTEPEPFLIIYKLTGTNRVSRSKLGNRFILLTESDAIYAAEFQESVWDCGLDAEQLQKRFKLIQTDWSTES
ncbi:hypothetical protein SDC9_69456 [bioreactor metagenome]|uniref:VCBS repeat-containing protein n=1 Tax=bioreactor metagenome TaxID=1076179 RepID=A0A644Y372_9ZZZZ